jgi:hypothetical protein
MNAPIPSAALTTGLSLHASLHTLAEEAWSRLRGTLEALGPLAQTMDEGQVASYELAFVSAELHAMRAMLDYAGRCAEGPKPADRTCGTAVSSAAVGTDQSVPTESDPAAAGAGA